MQLTLWWTKSRRAQNVDDYETWISGGVVPTLNVFDNASETRATVLIFSVDIYNADINENNFQTIRATEGITAMPSVLIIDGTCVNDVRVYEDGIVPTVISRYGTGGGNVSMVFPIDDAREIEKHQNGTGIGEAGAPAYTLDRSQLPAVALAFDLYNQQVTEKNQTLSSAASDASHTGTIWKEQTVRRLTPIECERLQGFPDDWTSGQADSNRYKQMGNAVAVPVVEWIVGRLVAQLDE